MRTRRAANWIVKPAKEARFAGCRKLFFALFLLSLSALSTQASAANIYLGQSSTGAGNGSDCSNTFAYSFFNNGGNWGGGQNQIGPGTTVHLCGTISGSGSPGSNIFTFQGSGTNGSPITLHWENGAIVQEPYFGTDGNAGISGAGNQYIILDGGTNGIIQSTLNGTSGLSCPGGPCQYQQASTEIDGNCSNCTIQNLNIPATYIHSQCVQPSGCDQFSGNNDGCIIFHAGGPWNNVAITNNVMHDARECIGFYPTSTGSNWTIARNTISRVGHAGISIGTNATVNTDKIYIYGNHIYSYANWDATNGGEGPYHHNAIHTFAGNNSGGTLSNLFIYNNEFGGPVGNCCVTAQLYIEPTGTSNTRDVTTAYIFNNVMTYANGDCSGTCGNGLLGLFAGTSVLVANNTLNGNATGSTPQGVCTGANQPISGVTFQNNIMMSCAVLTSFANLSFTSGSPSNDVYANGGSGGQVFQCQNNQYSALQLVSYIACVGNESNSAYSATAALSNLFVPQSGSPAIGKGANLTGTCSGQATPGLGALCKDKAGNPRPASGAWDVGAFNSGLNQPAPPSGLTAAVN